MKLTNNLMEFDNSIDVMFVDENEMKGRYKVNNTIKYFMLIETDSHYQVKRKDIHDISYDELKILIPDIKEDILKIVYGYFHKPDYLTYIGYAYNNHISESTLFRYVKKVKKKYYDSLWQWNLIILKVT